MLKIQRLNEGKVQSRSTVFAHTVIVVFGTEMLWKVDLFLYFLTEIGCFPACKSRIIFLRNAKGCTKEQMDGTKVAQYFMPQMKWIIRLYLIKVLTLHYFETNYTTTSL